MDGITATLDDTGVEKGSGLGRMVPLLSSTDVIAMVEVGSGMDVIESVTTWVLPPIVMEEEVRIGVTKTGAIVAIVLGLIDTELLLK